MKKNIQVGLIGLGEMSNHYIHLLSELDNIEIAGICDIDEKIIHLKGDEHGIPLDKRFSNYELLIRDPAVDAVISMVPNKFHAEIIHLCIQNQKPLMTEKPFTLTFEEAKELKRKFERQPILCMVGFSYRYIPSFRYVKKLLEENTLGSIRHLSVQYLQQWGSPLFETPFSWRFSKEMSGSGALGDLGSHMIDTARYFGGEFHVVSSIIRTFVKERKDNENQKIETVNVDDFSSFQAIFENGAIGTFVTSRNAVGAGNQLEITIFGDYGTIKVGCERPNEVTICLKSEKKDVLLCNKVVPEEYSRTQLQDFVDLILYRNPKYYPNFYDGYQNQKIIQEVIDLAHSEKHEFI